MASSINKKNIQGDIWPGLPKKFQTFLFFGILKPELFKERLKTFVITTAEEAEIMRASIKKTAKEKATEDKVAEEKFSEDNLYPYTGVNISFAAAGLVKLGKYTFNPPMESERKKYANWQKLQLSAAMFERGMYDDLVNEGLDRDEELKEEYKPVGKDKTRLIHGVIMVTSYLENDMNQKVEEVKKHFNQPDSDAVIDFPLIREGHALGGGREHFGFRDEISQPKLEGLDEQPKPKEPKFVKPGLIFTGYDNMEPKQPDWSKDGSFLVFRDLEQLVPEFDSFLERNKERVRDADHPEMDLKEKLGAMLMGRWKNGTPVDLSPHSDMKDDESFHNSNAFDYTPAHVHEKCPFAAHTRKMRPRGDAPTDMAVIIRRGIPYGEAVTKSDVPGENVEPKVDRGLLFVCYQSDIREGFAFLTNRWANNDHFPPDKHDYVGGDGPGVDPIINQRREAHGFGTMGLPDVNKPTDNRLHLEKWVIHRGGEYFFTPSIEALRGFLTEPPNF